jgi:hypothetical protein
MVVMNVCRSICGCIRGVRTLAAVEQFHIGAPQYGRIEPAFAAPAEKDLEVGTGVGPGRALVPRQVGRDCDP